MSAPFVPADQPARDSIAADLGDTLFVEAGAGAGKTTALVSRILALVAAGAPIEQIAAITFTEAAAAELREKVRQKLEAALASADGPADLYRQALREMDGAAIQTLHSFAGALLRERPLEAGLPPGFSALDEIEADLHFEERWQSWLDERLDAVTPDPALPRALGLGLRLDDLRALAATMHRDYDLLREPFKPEPEPPRAAVAALVAALPDLRRLVALANNGPEDPLAAHTLRLIALGERLASSDPESDSAFARLDRFGKLSCGKSRQGDWGIDGDTGQNACKSLKATLEELEDGRVSEGDAVRRAVLLPLLEELRRFVLDYVERRRTDGRAEFHDLLVWARDLLRNDIEARRHFQGRFGRVLIDEFQDTDPIQAEIAFFLAEAASGAPAARWDEVALTPGKLFVVGDPKQSIYRFRRADIAALQQVQGLIGPRPLNLVQNFRSQEGVIAWVNHLFGQWMGPGDPGLQPAYVPLAARWQPPQADPPLGVHWFGGPTDAKAYALRRAESGDIAAILADVKARWRVRDERDDTGATLRPANYADVCILLPTRTVLRQLEAALDEARVPYRVESQSLVLSTQDVRELLNGLRAVDSPADEVALVAALRSTAFACSDVDLVRFVEAGGRFNYLEPGAAGGPVASALETLRGYHEQRLWTPPDELIERFVRERRMLEVGLGRARPRERWRRLRFVVERARAFSSAGGASLRAFLDWMQRQAEENARVTEMPVPEADEDAVRVMTIHASKGLEFPIVLLAGLSATPRAQGAPLLFDRETGATEAHVSHQNGPTFETAGYATLREREKTADEAERVRLMYVAATRAKDHLILSLHRAAKGAGSNNSHAARMAAFCDADSPLWQPIVMPAQLTVVQPPDPPAPDPPPDTAEARAAWLLKRTAVIEAASRPAGVAATTIAQIEKEKMEAEEGEAPYRRGRAGTNFGRAVHSTLQSMDLATGAGLDAVSRAQAAAEGLPERAAEVAALVRRALNMGVVRRAVACDCYYREVFVGMPLAGGALEGFIDLLFAEPDGLVIADYKTDDVGPTELVLARERYALQVGAYALMAQQVTGTPVREVVLAFLNANHEEPFKGDELAALIERARAAAEAALSAPAGAGI